jgi:hypothetical protein
VEVDGIVVTVTVRRGRRVVEVHVEQVAPDERGSVEPAAD